MPFDPSQLKTQASALQYMKNAERLGRRDLYQAAFRRYCELANVDEKSADVLKDVWRAISAFELLMTERNGKTTRASRTRQKLDRDGPIKLVSDLATRQTPSDGFVTLVENGMADLTFEYIAIRHPDQFDEDVIAAAKTRLELAGVAL
jgi:hypothetical protein